MKIDKEKIPKEIDGLPVISTFEKDWQKVMERFMKEKKNFYLVGPNEYIDELYEKLNKKDLRNFLKLLLLGGASVPAVAGMTATKFGLISSLIPAAVVDPEPITKIILMIIILILGASVAYLIYTIANRLKKVEVAKVEINILGLGALRVEFVNGQIR